VTAHAAEGRTLLQHGFGNLNRQPDALRFGDLLREYRLRADLSQEVLAERAQLSTAAVSFLERGVRRAPYRHNVLALAKALGLNARESATLEAARAAAKEIDLAFHLPAQITSFVDREREVPEIKELLRTHRLVTLAGTGGGGKTRCAIHVAWDMLDTSSDGVWLVELAPISDPALVAAVIARTLALQESADRPILNTLLAYLKRKRLLLVLDNCEHVIEEARRLTAAILNDCPDVRILATSRESLHIAGEQVYRMPSLPVPSTSESFSTEELLKFGAVQLFSDRAASADNRFTLTVECAPHVADICRRLDGIPLAIELAAARVNVLSPRELAQKLDERFRILTAGDRSALPRHQTMRALIDWSYDLLSDDERMVFRSLSIFAGGFTLETAAAVCNASEVDEITVLDLLSSLVGKSLVQADLTGSDTRYRLLESTRQYAREKLRGAREEETTAHAHARAFLGLAEQLFDAWEITPDRAWHARAEPELENFRAALCWAFGARGDVLLGQQLAGLLRRVWNSFGPAEGRRWAHAAQQRVSADTPDTILALLDLAEAGLSGVLGQYTASLASAACALTRYRELADPRGVAGALGQMGRAQLFLGEIAEGEKLLEQALEIHRSLGARRSVMVALESLAYARRAAGDLAGAKPLYSKASTAARAVGAERYAATTLLSLAEAEFQGGDAAAALPLATEGLTALRALRLTHLVSIAETNITAYLVALRRYDEARTAAGEALAAARDAQYSAGVAWALQHFAAIAALRPHADAPVIEDRRRAARILGYVDAHLARLVALREYTEQQEYDVMLTALRDALDNGEISKLLAEGGAWKEDQAVAEAMLI
jgi:predicted ATPase/DNA-binding XRE family transcriptional regulator